MDKPGQMAHAQSLVEAFARLTAQQRELLLAPELDGQALNDSLAQRRAVLEQMQAVYGQLEQAGMDPEARRLLHGRLAEVQAMDDENLRLADAHATALREQARQMTQTRKGVSTYGRADLAGSGPLFDKKS